MSERPCPTCGWLPCANPSFCAACVEADRKAALRPKPDHNLPKNWDTMPFGALWECLNDPRRHPVLPKSIIQTFAYLVRLGDRERMKAWLAQCTPEQRRALKKLLDEK